jgi:hypothetical protein
MPNNPGSVGARGPLVPQKFNTPPQSEAPLYALDDGSDSWWAGVQQCAASVAIAAALTVTASQTLAASQQYRQDELPQTTVTFQPDEDYWQSPPPQVVSTAPPVVFTDDDTIIFHPDEDYWGYSPPPYQAPAPPRVFTDDDVIIPQAVSFQPDEDYWQAAIPPPQPPAIFPQPWTFDQQEPAGSLHGQPDEDYWINPVSPIPATMYLPLPLGDPEEIPAGSLHGQPDEDYWYPQLSPPLSPAPPRVFSDDELIVPQAVTFQPDEDYWLTFSQAAASVQRLYLPDPDEIPAGLLYGQPDEDYWQNPVFPAQVTFLWPQQWAFDEQFPVLFRPDEDYWQNPVAPAPVAYGTLYLPDPEEIPAGSLHGALDEDFYASPILGQAANIWPQQWQFDADAPVAATFVPDEDYWINAAQPQWVTMWQMLPFGVDPDQVPTQPVTSGIVPTLVYLGTSGDSGVTSGTAINVGGIG